MEDTAKMFDFGDESFSLTQLAQLNVEDVEPVRFTTFPKGSYRWRIEVIEMGDRPTKQGDRPVFAGSFVCEAVYACLDPEYANNPEKLAALVGRKYQQTWFIGTGPDGPIADIGRFTAFVADTGFVASGPFETVLPQMSGWVFNAPIKHKADRDDKDKIYVNFTEDKIKPYTPEN